MASTDHKRVDRNRLLLLSDPSTWSSDDLLGMLGVAEKRLLLAFIEGEPVPSAQREADERRCAQDDAQTGLTVEERQAVLAWWMSAAIADGEEALDGAL